jgi:hypothetical protein
MRRSAREGQRQQRKLEQSALLTDYCIKGQLPRVGFFEHFVQWRALQLQGASLHVAAPGNCRQFPGSSRATWRGRLAELAIMQSCSNPDELFAEREMYKPSRQWDGLMRRHGAAFSSDSWNSS